MSVDPQTPFDPPSFKEGRQLRLRSFEVDLDCGELRRDGRRVALQEKPFQLLAALLETPGKLVSREALREALWPDVFVDFDGNLNAAVKKLREALGDSATEPRYVETVPRRGYRLIAPVEPAPATPDAAASPPRRFRLPRAAAAGALAGAVLALAVAAGWLRPAETEPAPSPKAPGQRTMLAVLPFDNLSRNADHDYLSDGMTEEILTVLGRLDPDRLGVIARLTAMTYKGSAKPVSEIARELGVDYVLEGSVRVSGERARITAQLISADDQTHLWAEAYEVELDDLLDVQARIARRIGRSLALELLADPAAAAARLATPVPLAYDWYLRGRHQWRRFTAEGNELAIIHLTHATRFDPSYAQAHAALADAYNLYAFDGDRTPDIWFTKARASAEAALALDPDLAQAQSSLAFALLYGDYDPAAADPIFRRARELAPNDAMIYHWHAGALAALGRHDEAIDAARQALELDPLSLSVKSDLGWYYLFARRWADAERECRATLEASPGYSWATAGLIEALTRQGEHEEALRVALEHEQAKGRPVPDLAGLPAADGMERLTRRYLETELAKAGDGVDPLWRAILYGRLGRPDTALDWLERAYEEREPWLVFLRVDPRFEPLAGHPRFESLADRLRITG